MVSYQARCPSRPPAPPPTRLLLLLLAARCAADSDVTLRVFADGSGDYSSVQAALDSLAPGAHPELGHVTLLLAGTFRERVVVYSNFSRGVDLVAASSAGGGARPLVVYNESGAGGRSCSGSGGPGTSGSYTMRIDAADVRLRGVDVANDACGYNHELAGQSVALAAQGDRGAFFGVRLLGSQDTLYTGRNNRLYFADAFVNGSVDAIFGDGTAVFERAEIAMDFTVTAQKGNGSSAYLFLNSSVDALSGGPGSLFLGRPWGPLARTVFSGCALGEGVAAAGWQDWGHNCSSAPPSQTWCNETFYAEYNNSGPGWRPSERVAWAHVLGDEEGQRWTAQSLLGDWSPAAPP